MVRHLFAQQPVIDGNGLLNHSGNGELLEHPPAACIAHRLPFPAVSNKFGQPRGKRGRCGSMN
jgi:hypothetical protein